jgi:hypothetical protein
MYNTRGFGNPWILFREDVFEQVRKEQYPSKPSRMDSIFICESEAQLQNFLESSGRPLDVVYEIELTDPTASLHRGCLTHLDFSEQENLGTLRAKAHDYWSGGNVQRPEVLTTSSVRILSRI